MCPCNGVYLCHTCHRWAHDHPFEAMAVGLMISRHNPEPGNTPVLSWTGDQIMLDCEGGYVLADTEGAQQ